MATLQKCMECEKGATYSMHQFCKQDLSANNYLPNFANDLNIHENPNLSKSSTSNRMALNNFWFLYRPILILFQSQCLSINLFPKVLLFLVVKLNIV